MIENIHNCNSIVWCLLYGDAYSRLCPCIHYLFISLCPSVMSV